MLRNENMTPPARLGWARRVEKGEPNPILICISLFLLHPFPKNNEKYIFFNLEELLAYRYSYRPFIMTNPPGRGRAYVSSVLLHSRTWKLTEMSRRTTSNIRNREKLRPPLWSHPGADLLKQPWRLPCVKLLFFPHNSKTMGRRHLK